MIDCNFDALVYDFYLRDMEKEQLSPAMACAAKTLYAVMIEMKRRGGSMPAKDVNPFIEKNVEFTDWEKEITGKKQIVRWSTQHHFFSVGFVKAGFIIKKKGVWYLTPEGEEALHKGKEEMIQDACDAYYEWRRNRDEQKDDGTPSEAPSETNNLTDLDVLESNAYDDIRHFIVTKGPYEFQDLVAALLRAMGYYTPFIAPKGKDGGIDIIAYLDPLGAQTPRIKVQVKHKPDSVIGAGDVRALLGVMRDGDVALFVTSGSFSKDAKNTATTSPKFVRLIDGDEFIGMWLDYYDKMTDDDKSLLPLKRIAFLATI